MYLSGQKGNPRLSLAYCTCPPPLPPTAQLLLPHEYRSLFLLGLTAHSQGVSGGRKKLLQRHIGVEGRGNLMRISSIESELRDFPGGPGAKTPRSQCRGSGFDP